MPSTKIHNNAHPQPSLQPSLRTIYLTLYNTTFLALWLSILFTSLKSLPAGKHALYASTATRTRWIQTASLLEVGHAATGIIKSPVSTTALQTLTRVIQVWAIWYCFPLSTASSRAYGALVLAWSLADAIRYAYLGLNLWGWAPGALGWARYSMFYVLYPVGIGAEWWLMYRAIGPGREISPVVEWVFWGCLALYVPGSVKMYTYMIKQRKKTLGGERKRM